MIFKGNIYLKKYPTLIYKAKNKEEDIGTNDKYRI